jgi:NADPH-dependent 2,4-dienoyl-CoA reductase/sulfur reductase-like enzyme
MEQSGLVVVGASLAGLRAVESARKSGYSGRVTLIGAEEHLPYDRPPLSKEFLRAEPTADPVFRTERTLREDLGVNLRLGQYASGLDCRRHVVHLDGEEVPYSALVIATGAQARTLPNTAKLRGVFTLRTLDDARSVREALDAGARTVIIGAGFIGSEVASAARKRGLPVTIVEAAPVPLTRSVGLEMGSLLADLHRREGVDLRLGTEVERINGNGSVQSVVLTGGAEIPADLVVVGIGAAPSTGWLEDSGIELDARDKGVLCNRTLGTKAPRVHAAGDVCHWTSELFGRRVRLEHWTSAAEQGALAAHNALNPDQAKQYDTVPYFWSDWYDNRIQFVGEPSADDVWVIAQRWDDRKLLALYRKEDRIVAALTVNRPTLIMKLRRMIARRASWQEAVEFGNENRRT